MTKFMSLLPLVCLLIGAQAFTKKDKQELAEILNRPIMRLEHSMTMMDESNGHMYRAIDDMKAMIDRLENMMRGMAIMDEKYNQNQEEIVTKVNLLTNIFSQFLAAATVPDEQEDMEKAEEPTESDSDNEQTYEKAEEPSMPEPDFEDDSDIESFEADFETY